MGWLALMGGCKRWCTLTDYCNQCKFEGEQTRKIIKYAERRNRWHSAKDKG